MGAADRSKARELLTKAEDLLGRASTERTQALIAIAEGYISVDYNEAYRERTAAREWRERQKDVVPYG